jgi:hypothetical protein
MTYAVIILRGLLALAVFEIWMRGEKHRALGRRYEELIEISYRREKELFDKINKLHNTNTHNKKAEK